MYDDSATVDDESRSAVAGGDWHGIRSRGRHNYSLSGVLGRTNQYKLNTTKT